LGFDDGAALALVVALVVFDADVEVLGAVLVFEPQPHSTIARAAVTAAAPEIAVRLINNSCQSAVFATLPWTATVFDGTP
jgi:hypothetical protein